MTIFGRETKRALAPVLATLLTFLSVAVPLLDQDAARNRPVAESEHHPSTCVVGHDHTICTQAGANLALANETPGSRRLETSPEALLPTGSTHVRSRRPDGDRHPRAPPLA